MRSALLSLSLATAGCNQIFGLDPVVLVDAAPDQALIDAPLPTVRLTRMVSVRDPSGTPTSSPVHEVIDPPPIVQLGRVDGALVDATYGSGAEISIPYDFPGSRWRLVYTMPNEPPHEVQWAPAAIPGGHVIVPHTGGADRAPIPGPNARYSLTPSGGPGTHSRPRVFTTGVWTENNPNIVMTNQTVEVDHNAAVPIGGAKRAPDPARNDRVVLVDFVTNAACRTSQGSAEFDIPLVDGLSLDPTPGAWAFASIGGAINGEDLTLQARLAGAFDESGWTGFVRHQMMGRAVAISLPMFLYSVFGAQMPAPPMITLSHCSGTSMIAPAIPPFGNPDALTYLPLVGHLQIIHQRLLPNGAYVFPGIEAVAIATSNVANLDFSVGIPSEMHSFGGVDISMGAPADDVPVPAATGTSDLLWELDAAQARADYYVVTLHHADTAMVVPVRRYTVTERRVTVDRSLLTAGSRYLFEIDAFLGVPGAATGNFTTQLSTQSSATFFTRTFITQ